MNFGKALFAVDVRDFSDEQKIALLEFFEEKNSGAGFLKSHVFYFEGYRNDKPDISHSDWDYYNSTCADSYPLQEVTFHYVTPSVKGITLPDPPKKSPKVVIIDGVRYVPER